MLHVLHDRSPVFARLVIDENGVNILVDSAFTQLSSTCSGVTQSSLTCSGVTLIPLFCLPPFPSSENLFTHRMFDAVAASGDVMTRKRDMVDVVVDNCCTIL